mmetsp:Transcript_92792/g.198981  ORF Transcript_92792/g.198981 Transcript_92792/m.198981 type:complete len:310 (+) Transcript_92792:478-1407(+)
MAETAALWTSWDRPSPASVSVAKCCVVRAAAMRTASRCALCRVASCSSASRSLRSARRLHLARRPCNSLASALSCSSSHWRRFVATLRSSATSAERRWRSSWRSQGKAASCCALAAACVSASLCNALMAWHCWNFSKAARSWVAALRRRWKCSSSTSSLNCCFVTRTTCSRRRSSASRLLRSAFKAGSHSRSFSSAACRARPKASATSASARPQAAARSRRSVRICICRSNTSLTHFAASLFAAWATARRSIKHVRSLSRPWRKRSASAWSCCTSAKASSMLWLARFWLCRSSSARRRKALVCARSASP